MIRPQAARRPQCVVKWDRNLKPKLAIMRQCTSVADRRTDRRTLTSRAKNRAQQAVRAKGLSTVVRL